MPAPPSQTTRSACPASKLPQLTCTSVTWVEPAASATPLPVLPASTGLERVSVPAPSALIVVFAGDAPPR